MRLIVDSIIYSTPLPSGGVERVFNELLPRMCDLDPSLSIDFVTYWQLKQQLPSHSRIRHHDISSVPRPKRFWGPVYRELFYTLHLQRGRGALWHSTAYTYPKLWFGKQVVTVHDMIPERYRELFPNIQQNRVQGRKHECVQSADAVICVSETTRKDLVRFYGTDPDKCYVVPNAHSGIFRVMKTRERTDWPTYKPYLLYVGSRGVYKGFKELLHAYAQWSGRGEVDLVVVGSELSQTEQTLIAQLDIELYIHSLVNISDEQLVYLYNHAKAFVHTSYYEGFGLPILEAMACGCPVVASAIPTTFEVAGDVPVYFEPGDFEGMLRGVEQTLSEGRKTSRTSKGVKCASEYSWDRSARQTLEVYRQALSD